MNPSIEVLHEFCSKYVCAPDQFKRKEIDDKAYCLSLEG